MKRIVSLLLALTMILGACAGMAIAENEVTLSVVTGANIQSFFEGDDENHNYMIDYIEEKLGVNLEWNILPSENAAAKRNAMMASDNPPDVIGLGSRDDFLNYYSENMIQPLDEYVTDETFANDLTGAYKLGYLDGKCYAVSTPGNQSDTTYMWWYNKQLLSDAGIELPAHQITLEEFTDILYAVKEAYPDKIALGGAGNGSQQWLSGMQILYGAFGIANDFRLNGDGELEYALGTDDMKECLQYLNKLYADGILDPEYLVTTKETLNTKMMNNDVVSAVCAWYDYTGTYRNNIGNGGWPDTDHAWDYVNIIDGDKITCGQTSGKLNQYYMVVSYSCKHPKEAVELISLICTPEYYDKCFFGTEGEDYYYDENGARWRNQESQIGKGFSTSGTQWYVYYYFSETRAQRTNRLATGNPNYDMEYNMDCWYDVKLVDNPIAAMPSIKEYNESYTDVKDVAAEYFIKFVMGEYSFDQWEAFLAETESVGGTVVLEALQSWYDTL